MKKTLLFLALLASSSAALAQATFRPGYIVSLAGDTVRGAVDYRGEQRNALLCRFKPTTDAAVTEYEPGQIRGYGFINGHNLQSWVLPGAGTATHFVQTLVLGKASLYHFIDEAGKDTYYAGTAPAAPLEALIQQDTTELAYDQQKRRTVNMQVRKYPFRNVLWRIMADCPSVQTTVARMELREEPLVKVFTAYNACAMASKQQYVARPQRAKFRFSVLGGLQQAALTYTNKGDHELESGRSPVVGVGLMLQPGRLNPHFSFHLQALYLKQDYRVEFDNAGEAFYANETVHRKVDVGLTSLRIPALVRYTILSKHVQPYLQGGVGASIYLDRNATRQSTASRLNFNQTDEIELRTYTIGLTFGAGVSVPVGVGSVQVEVRGDRLDATSKLVAGEGALTGAQGLSFLLGYTFGK